MRRPDSPLFSCAGNLWRDAVFAVMRSPSPSPSPFCIIFRGRQPQDGGNLTAPACGRLAGHPGVGADLDGAPDFGGAGAGLLDAAGSHPDSLAVCSALFMLGLVSDYFGGTRGATRPMVGLGALCGDAKLAAVLDCRRCWKWDKKIPLSYLGKFWATPPGILRRCWPLVWPCLKIVN